MNEESELILNKATTGLLAFIINRTTYQPLLAEVMDLVESYWDWTVTDRIEGENPATGEHKRQMVLIELSEVSGELGKLIAKTASVVINLLIELAVSYLLARKQDEI